MLACRHCGQALGWAIEYCPFCGQAQAVAVVTEPTPEPEPRPAQPARVDRTESQPPAAPAGGSGFSRDATSQVVVASPPQGDLDPRPAPRQTGGQGPGPGGSGFSRDPTSQAAVGSSRLKPLPPGPPSTGSRWRWPAVLAGLAVLGLGVWSLYPPARNATQPPTPRITSAPVGSAVRTRDPAPTEVPGTQIKPNPIMVPIPVGSFLMGCQPAEKECYDWEKPAHLVQVPAFEIGKYEVTFDEWDVCVADGGCTRKPEDEGWGRGKRPVINVSWDDAQEYATWLSRKTGKPYRLPSEAEWEYAARAGTQTAWSFGDDEQALVDFAWFRGNAGGKTHPVGEKRANPWGLYDIHGNVWEWVQDNWHNGYQGAPADARPWEGATGVRRVLRGGSWIDFARIVRSAYRPHDPGNRYPLIGFRLVLGPQPSPEKASR